MAIRTTIFSISIAIVIFKYNQVFAGAWLPKADTSEVIFTTSASSNNNEVIPSIEYYSSRGINDRLALVVSQNVKFDNKGFALSHTTYDAQILLHKYKGVVASTRIGITSSKNTINDNISTRPNADLLLGANIGGGFWLNLEGGFRDCFGNRIYPAEFTIGKHINKANMLYLKSGKAGCEFNTNNTTYQISYIHSLNQNISIEMGYRTKSYGRLNDIAIYETDEVSNSFIFSIWKKY